MHVIRYLAFISILLAYTLPVAAGEDAVSMQVLSTRPVLDGDPKEWGSVNGSVIPLKKINQDTEIAISEVLIKGGVYGDDIYFYIEWEDASEDTVHKPWLWDARQSRYVRGPKREDRLALQFKMSGDYSTNWFSGNVFSADMWHWKASRSNPLGLAHDKSTTISRNKLLRSSRYTTPDGTVLYIHRPSDAGSKLYQTKRYSKYQNDEMPKYILNENPKGSSADIKAKGVWKDGKWRLELRRKRNTGNDDDVVFPERGIVLGGIAIFDHSENDDHVISETLEFHF